MNNASAYLHRFVHLDFHTSPDIRGVGSRFDKKKFQDALKAGHVQSMTVFAKCHHGVCYYPTKIGKMHPGLNFDLTGALVDAAHEIGVKAPIYITAGWSDEDAAAHPEWCTVKKGDPEPAHDPCEPKPFCKWKFMCLNDGSYCRHIYALTEEICQRYPKIDGLFYDICLNDTPCYCPECLQGMKTLGLNPEKEEDAHQYYVLKHQSFMTKCGEIMRKYHPCATIFFNSGGANIFMPEYQPYSTHYEMEDLPTAWGGYDKLPLNAKYFAHKGTNYFGMTGKFHLDWGEFGGFKTKEALRYEAAAMAMWGAGCSIGDHMHPDGEMEGQTYQNIGYAFSYLEKIAPYCYGGETVTDLGLYLSPSDDASYGLSDILLENQIDFDVVYEDNYDKFSTVIFPSGIHLSKESLAKLKNFVERGGKVLAVGDSLIENGQPVLDFGIDCLGEAEFDCDYLISNRDYIEELPNAPMLCYIPARKIAVNDAAAEVLAESLPPYFSRTYGHFCGHRNTPHNKDAARLPAIVKKGNLVYVAHDLPSIYRQYGSVYYKRYFMMALRSIYQSEAFSVTGLASQGRCSMIHQPNENRYCLNLTYASPVKRGKAEIIDDILPIYQIEITVKTEKTIRRVSVCTTGETLDFTNHDGQISFTLPRLCGHEAIALDY